MEHQACVCEDVKLRYQPGEVTWRCRALESHIRPKSEVFKRSETMLPTFSQVNCPPNLEENNGHHMEMTYEGT